MKTWPRSLPAPPRTPPPASRRPRGEGADRGDPPVPQEEARRGDERRRGLGRSPFRPRLRSPAPNPFVVLDTVKLSGERQPRNPPLAAPAPAARPVPFCRPVRPRELTLQVHLGASRASARCPVSTGRAAAGRGTAKESQAPPHGRGPWFRGRGAGGPREERDCQITNTKANVKANS